MANTRDEHIDNCSVGAEDWRVHNFELNKDDGFVNYQTQHRANPMHQPAKVTQISTRSA